MRICRGEACFAHEKETEFSTINGRSMLRPYYTTGLIRWGFVQRL